MLEITYNRQKIFRDCKVLIGCNCNSFPWPSQRAKAQTLSAQNNSQQCSVLYLSKFHYHLHLQGAFHYITVGFKKKDHHNGRYIYGINLMRTYLWLEEWSGKCYREDQVKSNILDLLLFSLLRFYFANPSITIQCKLFPRLSLDKTVSCNYDIKY